jgi:uncharacterized membrane protein
MWVLPPLRQPLTRAAVVPLLAFLAVFFGVALTLHLTDVMMFVAPLWFLLMLLAPWLWWMHICGYAGLVGRRGTVALLVRLALLGLFAALLAQPRSVLTNENLSIMFVLDRSASVSSLETGASDGTRTVDEALALVARIVSNKPPKDEAGLMVFGRDSAIQLPPSVVLPLGDDLLEDITVQIDPTGTNVPKALATAAAVMPEDKQKRIVLISDGTSTEGELGPVLADLKSRGIIVDVLPIAYDHEDEVWLDRLELPRHTKIGETYEAAVIVSSLKPGKGTLVLLEGGQAIFRDEVTYKAGKNRFAIPIHLRTSGYYAYEATLEVPDETVTDAEGVQHTKRMDGWRRNNKALSYLYLKGKGEVLLVIDPTGDSRDWETLRKTLSELKRSVKVIGAYDFPTDPLALLPYDCVIFANVPSEPFAANQFAALSDAVKNQGSGFLMIGGKNSFAPGGYNNTEVEKILPVRMDVKHKKVLPKSAMVITLHTCEFPQGNTWGKRITKEAIQVLSDRDDVGVLVYDWEKGDSWLFPLTPAGEYDKLKPKIEAAQIGDMPAFGTTMQMGLNALVSSDASARHMIIISDGDAQAPTPALLAKFVAAQITVTTVAVFPHQGMGTQVMQAIAKTTGGRFYKPRNAAKLPSIFVKEAKTLRRSMIKNVTFTPEVRFPSPILRGIDALPQLHGYVLTSPKSSAKTILDGPEEDEDDPILATWKAGVGTTAAFTSDLSPRWGADWVNWPRYQAFVQQLITSISRVNKPSFLHMQSFASGNSGIVSIEDYARDASFLDLQASVTGPGNETETRQIELRQTGAQRYEGKFELWGEGRYKIVAAGTDADREDHVNSGFVVPFSHEYLRFSSNPIALTEILETTGGRQVEPDATADWLYGVPRHARSSSTAIFHWFLLALAVLVPLDVACRRIQLDMHVIRRWFGIGRPVTSAQTFEMLLKRKTAVTAVLRNKTQPAPLPAARGPELVIDRSTVEKPATSIASEPPADDAALSTTERLLALKRRRGEDEDEDDS